MTKKTPFSPAEKTGAAAIILAVCLFALNPFFALLPLAGFVLICFIAPFLPRSRFFLPVVSRGAEGVTAVALTFDDGPSPDSTPALLRLLEKYQLKACFFVIGEKALAYPELIKKIRACGHTIGNHSYRHDNLLMLRSYQQLKNDIKTTQDVLAGLGCRPVFFRPPVGITNPKLKRVLEELDLTAVNFSCRIFDRGNRRIMRLADKVLNRVGPGDIILLHDRSPGQDHYQYWLDEIENLFAGLQKKYKILPLKEIINHESD